MDTKLCGNLYAVRTKDIGAQIVVLRVYGTDDVGIERDVIFEYELPTNFRYQK